MDGVATKNMSLTLFCFPCAGASATSYFRWRRLVPPWLRIEPVELPGRGMRMDEGLIRDFDALTGDLTAKIAPLANGRYALFGHSMGALLAYGCAHSLIRNSAPAPVALAVAAAAAPSLRLLRQARRKSETELIEDLRRLNGTPEALFDEPQLLAMTLSVLAADYDICESFRFSPVEPLACPIFIYGGALDSVDRADLAAWREASAVETRPVMFEGGHFFLREQEAAFLRQLVRDLSSMTFVG